MGWESLARSLLNQFQNCQLEKTVKLKIAQNLVLASLALSGAAFAQTATPDAAAAAAPAVVPDTTLAYNIGAVTEYRYRGLAQSAKEPAIQGGIDFSTKGGLYLGTWASNISWIKDTAPPNAKGPVEIDLYGGYKGNFTDTVSYDVGGLEYWYATNNLADNGGANANTFELYGSVTAGIFKAKYSSSLTTLFGALNSKGSGYLDLSLNFDLGNGITLAPHIGNQVVKNVGSYNDYSLALGKDMGDGLSLSATLVGNTHADAFKYLAGSGTKDMTSTTVVLGILKTF